MPSSTAELRIRWRCIRMVDLRYPLFLSMPVHLRLRLTSSVRWQSTCRQARGQDPLGWSLVVLAGRATVCPRRPPPGRATSVPFTTVPTGPQRTLTDNTTRGRELHRPLSPQVAILPDLALQARGRLVEACIGLAVPGRPIGHWSRRTGALTTTRSQVRALSRPPHPV